MKEVESFDSAQDPDNRNRSKRKWLERFLFAIVFLGVGLLIAYLFLKPDGNESSVPDLLVLAASQADLVQITASTNELVEAESFILGEFGWPAQVPEFPEVTLVGVGIHELAPGVELPVLRYEPSERAPFTVFIYDYAFLDDAAGRLRLAPGVYARLAEDEAIDVRRTNDEYLVLWRERAVIYSAVVHDDPDPIVESLRR